ncbi:MAG: hypothetical protein HY235_03450 [Acidobacteria bacterium]|nr:hypothetical protein [Acidobacteriota bacterium]
MLRRDLFPLALAPLAAGAELLKPSSTLGSLQRETAAAPIEGATWFRAESEGAGLEYRFPAGLLAGFHSLTTDMLLDGSTLIVFTIALFESGTGRRFQLRFAGLNQCSFRVRMPLSLVDQSRWQAGREGAFLKPLVGGDRVDLAKVDRLTFTMTRKAPGAAARWCMTRLQASPTEVPKLTGPILPKGPLLDELGQSRLHDWPAKTRTVEQMRQRVRAQFESASKQNWPEEFSRWGGCKAKKFAEGSGFFRTHHDGRRWWLADPNGYAFWSAGIDCVRVDCEARSDGLEDALSWKPDPNGDFKDVYRGGASINYLAANLIRAFGSEGWREKWAAIALAQLRRLRFNTVGNWSEWEFARRARFPYVRPLTFLSFRTPFVYRDFPDVFHPGFEQDAAAFAAQLGNTADDPALLGYFLMNEPTWGFSSELPAAGMLYATESCHTRAELERFLRDKYHEEPALESAWKMPVTFERIAKGKWSARLSKEALADLRDFSGRMTGRYFRILSAACRRLDPNHLNLGMRWAGIPPDWAVQGMKSFDVFSLNCYMEKLPLEQARKIRELLNMPVLVGEWHFGALDVGLPASGIGHLKNQADRAKAYRVYLEDAAADPDCVGVHWFTLYDQSALGRFDGENYNIGFLDICHRPYEELSEAAIASHERMYALAEGRQKPFSDAPVHLPRLFL